MVIFHLFEHDRWECPLLWTAESPMTVSQQREDAVAVLIKPGHTDPYIQIVYIYACDYYEDLPVPF
jgi:hypothetical protein